MPISATYPSPPASPKLKPVATVPTDKAIADLRERFFLDTGRCYSIKQDRKSFCSNRIALNGSDKDANTRANELLAQLMQKPGTAAQLEQILEDLATKVHCTYHGTFEYIEARIDTWLLCVSAYNKDEPYQLSQRRHLRRIIGQLPQKCTGFKASRGSDGPRNCFMDLGGEKRIQCEDSVMAILACTETPGSEDSLSNLFTKLKRNLLCRYHDKKLCRQEKWETRLDQFNEECRAAARRVNESAANESDTSPPKAIVPASPSKLNRESYLTSKFEIRATGDDLPPDTTWQEALDTLLKTPLNQSLKRKENETISGFIYAYTVEGNSDLIKIGYTTRSVALRHKEWEDDCLRKPISVYEGTVTTNAFRVEKLIHAELVREKVRVFCVACQKQHLEFFKIGKDKAMTVIRKWERWMRSNPYGLPAENRDTKRWLKWTEKQRLVDIEEFLEEIATEG